MTRQQELLRQGLDHISAGGTPEPDELYAIASELNRLRGRVYELEERLKRKLSR